MIPFNPPHTQTEKGGSELLDRIMQKLKDTFGSLAKVVTNDALVTKLIGATDTRVYHGLGRKVTTWDVVNADGAGVVFQSATVNSSPTTYIILKASAPVTVTLRFT